LLQLTTGDIISAFTRQVMKVTLTQSTRLSNGDQTQANAAIQQVQAVYSAAFWNITLQIQAAKNSNQQYANSLSITSQQDQAFLSQRAQNLTAVGNS
jgi:hypothetical protein